VAPVVSMIPGRFLRRRNDVGPGWEASWLDAPSTAV